MGQPHRQNPLCNLLYQQEGLCRPMQRCSDEAAKAAMKTEPTDNVVMMIQC